MWNLFIYSIMYFREANLEIITIISATNNFCFIYINNSEKWW